ncbi:MAG: aminotransferase class I/II-fold pyridoxal phosphate-dependent enzyme [Zetaproteobacteria bacterium]|nr:MAG: aminotransferase class I/II-fold pyridoxal phosphate-dependent enzyme [Zetaproteobacteria bacterium]
MPSRLKPQPRLARLAAYPFVRLQALLADLRPAEQLAPIDAGAGEPRLPPAGFLRDALCESLDGFCRYPPTRGTGELRRAVADWVARRYPGVRLDPDRQVLSANGTREALFAVAHAAVDPDADPPPYVLLPDPMYQIYLGAAVTAGAIPYPVAATAATGFLPDWRSVPEQVWARTALLYCCSPSNPTGRVMGLDDYRWLIEQARCHDFLLVADECYSEIYYGHPPAGLLQAAVAAGCDDFHNCLVCNSLSKRSGLPGLRSGFIAGDEAWIDRFASLRSYTGPATPLPLQHVAAVAWRDEEHVAQARECYRASLDAFHRTLGVGEPAPGGFFAWLPVSDDEAFARAAWREAAVRLLPGSYLGTADAEGVNPGAGFVRVALVDGVDRAEELGRRLARLLEST